MFSKLLPGKEKRSGVTSKGKNGQKQNTYENYQYYFLPDYQHSYQGAISSRAFGI